MSSKHVWLCENGDAFKSAVYIEPCMTLRNQFYKAVKRGEPWKGRRYERRLIDEIDKPFKVVIIPPKCVGTKGNRCGISDEELATVTWCDVVDCNDRKACMDKGHPQECLVWKLIHVRQLQVEKKSGVKQTKTTKKGVRR